MPKKAENEFIRNPRWEKAMNKNLERYLQEEEHREDCNEWTSQEIADLADMISKYGCANEAVIHEIFYKRLKRSEEEIKTKITDVLEMMLAADDAQRASYFKRCDQPDPEIKEPLTDDAVDKSWFSAVHRMVTDPERDVIDNTTVLWSDFLEELAALEAEKGQKHRESGEGSSATVSPDYEAIYNTLSAIGGLKYPKRGRPPLPPLESAVFMSVVEEIEREVDQNLRYRMPAYAALFRDLQQRYFNEFLFCRNVARFDEDFATAHLNLFGLDPPYARLYPPQEDDDNEENEEPNRE